MLKYCLENWELNKEELREHLKNFNFVRNEWRDLIILTVKYIFPKNIRVENFIYLGDFSGEMITILCDKNIYGKEGLFLGHTYFNSLDLDDNSYDALSAAEDIYSEEKTVDNLMKIAYQFIQSIIHPYSGICKMYDEEV